MTAVAKKTAAPRAQPVVDVAKLPGLSKAQIKIRLAAKNKSGKVAEMSFRSAGIKHGEL